MIRVLPVLPKRRRPTAAWSQQERPWARRQRRGIRSGGRNRAGGPIRPHNQAWLPHHRAGHGVPLRLVPGPRNRPMAWLPQRLFQFLLLLLLR